MATVAAILEGAAQVLEQEGIDGFTTNAIARRAGVSIGTLYQYYPDKAAIAAALSREVRAGLVARIAKAAQAARAVPLEEGLRLLVVASLQNDAARPRFARWLDVLEAHLGLNREEAASIDQELMTVVTSFLEAKFAGASHAMLVEVADEIRATTGALTDAALRRGAPLERELAERIVVVALALLRDRFSSSPLLPARRRSRFK